MALLPNVLTTARLIMVPFFIFAYIGSPEYPIRAFLIYALAMLTDALDGFLARALKCTSRFGKLVDPLADKMMTIAAISCLAWSGLIPIALLALIAAREVIMMLGACAAAKNGIVISAGVPGKMATLLFTASMLLIMPWHGVPVLQEIGGYLIYVAAGVSLYATAYYAAILSRRVSKVKAP